MSQQSISTSEGEERTEGGGRKGGGELCTPPTQRLVRVTWIPRQTSQRRRTSMPTLFPWIIPRPKIPINLRRIELGRGDRLVCRIRAQWVIIRFQRGLGLGLGFPPDAIRAFAFRLDGTAFGGCAYPRRAERPWGTTSYGEMRQRAGVRG